METKMQLTIENNSLVITLRQEGVALSFRAEPKACYEILSAVRNHLFTIENYALKELAEADTKNE